MSKKNVGVCECEMVYILALFTPLILFAVLIFVYE